SRASSLSSSPSLSPSILAPCPLFFFLIIRPPPRSTHFPYATLFRSRPRGLGGAPRRLVQHPRGVDARHQRAPVPAFDQHRVGVRSEEHTSELQSRRDLVCRLLLEKKKKKHIN